MGIILIMSDQMSLASVQSVEIHEDDATRCVIKDEWESIDGSATAIR